jgi:hypothetical protein
VNTQTAVLKRIGKPESVPFALLAGQTWSAGAFNCPCFIV